MDQLNNEGCDPCDIVFRRQLELRYKGQSSTIPIDWTAGADHQEIFNKAHSRASGLQLPHPVELVNLRLSARGPAVLKSIDIQDKGGSAPEDEMVHMPELAVRCR